MLNGQNNFLSGTRISSALMSKNFRTFACFCLCSKTLLFIAIELWAEKLIGLNFWVELILRSPDTLFYEMPRFVTHIDDQAIAALTKYYSEVLPPSNAPGVAILDMCSSWVRYLLLVILSFPEHAYMIIN